MLAPWPVKNKDLLNTHSEDKMQIKTINKLKAFRYLAVKAPFNPFNNHLGSVTLPFIRVKLPFNLVSEMPLMGTLHELLH